MFKNAIVVLTRVRVYKVKRSHLVHVFVAALINNTLPLYQLTIEFQMLMYHLSKLNTLN